MSSPSCKCGVICKKLPPAICPGELLLCANVCIAGLFSEKESFAEFAARKANDFKSIFRPCVYRPKNTNSRASVRATRVRVAGLKERLDKTLAFYR